MKESKKIIPAFTYSREMLSLKGGQKQYAETEALQLCHYYSDHGADALLIQDLSATDEEHERALRWIKKAAGEIDIPIITGGYVKRLEDIKKYLYTGVQSVYLDVSIDEQLDMLKEASDRFGTEKLIVYADDCRLLKRSEEFQQLGASGFLLDQLISPGQLETDLTLPVICLIREQSAVPILQLKEVCGGITMVSEDQLPDCMTLKQALKTQGIPVQLFESRIGWEQLKKNESGLIPVIVQDYKTMEVLMMAYMDQEAFDHSLKSGRMTYYSRSRKRLWLKGETSGHFQYIKELTADCDQDTILAKVKQIGAACHTGTTSCFYETLVKKEYSDSNPLKVFQEVYSIICHRKECPREGSYTNYLFDKGIDKILKKLGEEATEIVIASKNPNTDEIKYEISDFLYHLMVLMAEKNITWEEITRELNNRI